MASFITAGNATNGLQVSSDNTGILELKSGTGSGTTAVTIGTTQNAIFAGNVGIGTSSPSTKLNVQTAGADVEIRASTTTSGDVRVGFDASGAVYNWIQTQRSSGAMQFAVANAERARIDTASLTLTATRIIISGASGIPAPVNNGDGNVGTTAANGLNLIGKGSTNDIIFLNNAGSTAGRVATGATTITTSSDERLKENLVPIENAVDKVIQLRTVTGNYKSDPSRNVAFLIAQDVDAVFPQAVEKGDPEELGINYNWIIPLALAAIKEQQAMIDELKAEIAALKGNA
jgi:hypothetical protein